MKTNKTKTKDTHTHTRTFTTSLQLKLLYQARFVEKDNENIHSA